MKEIRTTRQPAYMGEDIEVRIIDKKERSFCKAIEMVPYKIGEFIPSVMTLEMSSAQELMNSLWDCGLRPSADAGSSGQLTATEKHLDDMRNLTFRLVSSLEKNE